MGIFNNEQQKDISFVTETGKEIRSEYDLLDYMNESDDWPNDIEKALEACGWTVSSDDFDVAYNLKTKEYITTVEDRNGVASFEIRDLPEDYEIRL